jgi:hypothetical protein
MKLQPIKTCVPEVNDYVLAVHMLRFVEGEVKPLF